MAEIIVGAALVTYPDSLRFVNFPFPLSRIPF